MDSFWDKYYKFKFWFFDDYLYSKKWYRKTTEFYWGVVPYNYRPGQIWYRLKCWGWKRYTTVKPRYLGYGWCDRCNLLPYMMFEILSDFIEGECSPGHIEWYSEECPHKIKVCGKLVWVRDEMQDLYDWWHKIYIPWDENQPELHEWCDYREKYGLKEINEDGDEETPLFDLEFESKAHKQEERRLAKVMHEADQNMDRQLKHRLHRLINVMDYMWT